MGRILYGLSVLCLETFVVKGDILWKSESCSVGVIAMQCTGNVVGTLSSYSYMFKACSSFFLGSPVFLCVFHEDWM